MLTRVCVSELNCLRTVLGVGMQLPVFPRCSRRRCTPSPMPRDALWARFWSEEFRGAVAWRQVDVVTLFWGWGKCPAKFLVMFNLSA